MCLNAGRSGPPSLAPVYHLIPCNESKLLTSTDNGLALYENGIRVSYVSGKFQYFSDLAGNKLTTAFNGVLGIALDRTENYALVTSAEGKKLRKLSLLTLESSLDVSSKCCQFLSYI
jgi:hypothetical protein